MKKNPYQNLVSFVLCLIFSVCAFSQSKDAKSQQKFSQNAAAKFELSKMETSVVEELNTVRRNPLDYIKYLEEWHRATDGTIIKMKNQPPIKTIEGASAIVEAVEDLKKTAGLKDFQVGEGLTAVARAQLADLQENSELGHYGKDGSDLKVRLGRFGKATGKCGENICHRGASARDVVRIFLVDDGVTQRSHRKAVLSKNFTQIGVACGAGKKSESLCVVVFADSFKDKTAVADTVEY